MVMGVVNATPDSFYAYSRAGDVASLCEQICRMADEGADMIDIGAYSTRPGAGQVPVDEEKRRLGMAAEAVKVSGVGLPLSVDTFRAEVARYAVERLGFGMVNDIGGGTLDPDMLATVADLDVPYIAMHMRGTPETMQQFAHYDNVAEQVTTELSERLQALHSAGVKHVILDPGFGFAKTLEQNYALLAGLQSVKALGAPVLVGVSRKSMIYKLLGCTPENALNGTTVVNTIALMAGADILRVHDVKAAVEARTIVMKTRSPHPPINTQSTPI